MCLSPLAVKPLENSEKSVRDKVRRPCDWVECIRVDGLVSMQAVDDLPALVRALAKPFNTIELLQLWRALFYCTVGHYGVSLTAGGT